MMQWDTLLSALRFGQEHLTQGQHTRNEFQRDYDRLIFSSAFRRLQNKTQVFPLPGSIFVHNRLTHSLEVSCVGRSLASNAAAFLAEKYKGEEWTSKLQSLDDIVATACLAHDMGNPPFGHSGERAIISYFSEGAGSHFRDGLNPQVWSDITHYDGNANAFRLLSHQFNGRRQGGFALTYSTLASIIKYPYSSLEATRKPKFGFFASEQEAFHRVVEHLGMQPLDADGRSYSRHPLVWLVEAADDICYQIMDIEDACHLKLLTQEDTIELLLQFFEGEMRAKVGRGLTHLADDNEQIAYLRSRVIGTLVYECGEVFNNHEQEILSGSFSGSFIGHISDVPRQAYQACSKLAVQRIYNAHQVVEIEIAGHQIISVLLDRLLDAVNNPNKAYSRLLLDRVPSQYEVKSEQPEVRIMAVLDYISGMTDVYALDLYRKIYGMSLPSL